MATVVSRQDLIDADGDTTFRGSKHGAPNVSYIWVELEPGQGPRLHQHSYEEVFVVLEGTVTFTVGGEVITAQAGDTVVGPANVPHKFVNSGPGTLRQVDIHATGNILTEWLHE
ncbi:MAG: cupin domain-containing protein [Chloroflexota bacterium]|nr:cupin domain-containing protein [Chloroflexota bacterium]